MQRYYSSEPVTLSAYKSYYIASEEVDGGDYWHGSSTTLVHTADAIITGIAKTYKGNWETISSMGNCVGPVSFIYSIPGETP